MARFTAATATATGSNPSITVPSNEQWRVKASLADLNASAATNSRQMSLEIVVNSLYPLYVPVNFVQVGGHVYYAFAPSLPSDSATVENDDICQGFPEVVLGPGDKIQTDANNLDSGDVVTLTVNYEVERA